MALISYSQNFEDIMLWRALGHVENGFYVDVGANDPTADSVTKLFYDRGWSGINIEPLSVHLADLERERPRDINLCCAAGPTRGEIEIWECEVRGWTTADKAAIAEHIAQGDSGNYLQVPMSTLTEICRQHAPQEIHFLKIDVEGFERSVLEGMDFGRFRPWIVVVEATRANADEKVQEPWESLLTTANYVFVYADGLNRFYRSQEHAEVAGAFRYPPNVFDDFVKVAQIYSETLATQAQARATQAQAAMIEAQTWASQMEAQANRAEAGMREAQASASQAETHAAQAEAQANQAETHAAQAEAQANQANARATYAEAHATDAEARVTALMNSLSWRITAPMRFFADVIGYLKAGTLRSHLRRRVAGPGAQYGADVRAAHPLAYLSPHVRRIYVGLKNAVSQQADLLGVTPTPTMEFDAHSSAASGSIPLLLDRRPRLAYVSPLPPERSGISDYSAELLPELARFYAIDVVVDQAEIASPWVRANCGVRSAAWLLQNAHDYDRVLYHFGNSRYHLHMFELLARVPGVVVLHDFYLGDVCNILEEQGICPHAYARALYDSHGYAALAERLRTRQVADMIGKYPANLDVLQLAQGVIVHSRHSQYLADTWYGQNFSRDWSVIPLLRRPDAAISRAEARKQLGFKPDDFLVCSFGVLTPAKLNHRLLNAWLNSGLADAAHCHLVFVGETHSVAYEAQLMQAIEAKGPGQRIRITGWADRAQFQNYLAGADVAVQLRAHSRGETSAAVLDCMNHALATIVNAHGALAELPGEAVWMLPEKFEDGALTQALEALWQDGQKRAAMGQRAQELIRSRHDPRICARQYAQAIEQAYSASRRDTDELVKNMAQLDGRRPTDAECVALAQSIAAAVPNTTPPRQLLVDVTAISQNDLKTGIQRVVRALVWELIQAPPPGYRVEPVYLTDQGQLWHYCYAREWTAGALGFATAWMTDEPVEFAAGDALLIADFTAGFAVEAERTGVFQTLKNNGVGIHFCVYDLLPIKMPEFFPPGQFGFLEWLHALTGVADGAICISQTTAEELRSWVKASCPARPHPMRIDWFHLGADIKNSIPTCGLPKNAEKILSRIKAAPSFLMVGTIEPRKGYLQTLDAFAQLWQEGVDVNLVIVGKMGWRGLSDSTRRTTPEISDRLRQHPELGQRLLWLEGISDEYLEKIYAASRCLIAASEGEGFGLPLIEAAQHKLPIIARDIPVFREVAGKHAYYFVGLEPWQLVEAIMSWLDLEKNNKAPASFEMPWLTWKQSSENLVRKLGLTPVITSNSAE